MGFSDKFQQIVSDENASKLGLLIQADQAVTNLQNALNATREELDRLKNAKCQKCGTDLPASGKCIICAYKKLPQTPDAAFLAGLNSFAWALVILRRHSLNLNHASFLKVFIEKVYAKRNEPDRLRAAESVFAEMVESNLFQAMQIIDNHPSFNDFEKEFCL